MKKVFLSYARCDDEPFARRLYSDLSRAGFEVWFDRVSMPSRQLTFLHEIRDAIATCERLVLVIGPQAIASDYVTQEWQFAYFAAGICINPVVRLDGTDVAGKRVDGYLLIPNDLKHLHTEDLRDESSYAENLRSLCRQLSEDLPPTGKLVAVPELPTNYRAHPKRLQTLRNLLLADLHRPVVVTGASARIGVHGMGGIGKSVLATALARHPEVRRSFKDGIFWVGFGETLRVTDVQRWLVRQLGGEGSFDDESSGKEMLRELLSNRFALIILDNVWHREHAEAFNVVGPLSRLLFTTRDAGLVTALSDPKCHYQVELPTQGEAESILASATQVDPSALPQEAQIVVTECGRLPLALALCGGMVQGGSSWRDVLEALREHELTFFSTRYAAEDQHQNLWKALDISLRALGADERDRFAELAVFSRGGGAPDSAIATYWEHTANLSPRDTRKLLADFARRSIVQIKRIIDPEAQVQDRDGQVQISLHDLIHNFAEGMAVKRFGSVNSLHDNLLQAYREKCTDGWSTGPSDGYFFDYLNYHLHCAGREDQWRALLISFHWLEQKTRVCGFPAVLQDLQQYAADSEIGPLHRVCRRAAHVLTHDPKQLAAQLIARLNASPGALGELLQSAQAWADSPWLRPVRPSLGEDEPTIIVFRGREKDGHAGTPRSIALSPDNDMIASGGGSYNDLTVKVWSRQAARRLRTYAVEGGALGLAFIAPKGLLAFAVPHEVRLYALDADQPEARRTFDDSQVSCICGSRQARIVLIGFEDGRVLAWDTSADTTRILRDSSGDRVIAMAHAATSSRLAIATASRVECRDEETGQVLAELNEPSGIIRSLIPRQPSLLKMSADGLQVFFGGPLRVWTIGERTSRGLIENIDTSSIVDVTDDGTMALIARNSRELEAIAIKSGKEIGWIKNDHELSCLKLTYDGQAVATCDFEHDVKVWDLNRAQTELTEWQRRGRIRSVDLYDDLDLASVVADDDASIIWSIATGAPVAKQEPVATGRSVLRRYRLLQPREPVQRSPIEQAFLSRHPPPDQITFWRDDLIALSRTAGRAISALSPMSKSADVEEEPLTSDHDGATIKVWDIRNMDEPRILRGHTMWISCADMTADGTRAITGSRGRLLRLWDLDTGVCLHVLRGHRGIVYDCALSKDAQLAISGSEDMTVRLWDLSVGKLLFTFAASSAVTSCDISRDGAVAIAGETSGRIHTFSLAGINRMP